MPLRLILACVAVCALMALGSRPDGTATAAVPLRYVALGDSLTEFPGYVQLNVAHMEQDLDANVTLVNLGKSGWASTDLRNALASNSKYRNELAQADVVTVGIGFNDLYAARLRYLLGTCGGADGQDCLRDAVTTFRARWEEIDSILRSLTSARSAVIRPWDVYYTYIDIDEPGLDAVFTPYWAQVNAHIAASTAASATTLAGVAAVFNGASGLDDPAAKGYLAADGVHLSDAGSAAIAAIFRANGYGNAATDGDGDDVADRVDNCPAAANPLQENTDSDVVDLSPWGKTFDDFTWPNSDNIGDACDDDDDNDGLPDATELTLTAGGCPSATAATDPLKLDTDGDGVSDVGECLLSSDPADASSLPNVTVDADNDGLFDGTEVLIGTNPMDSDSDGDGVPDGAEVRRFASNPLSGDTDGDGCGDRHEVGSLNADRTMNALDMSQLAQSYGPADSPRYVAYFDWNGDHGINAIDLMFGARFYGACTG